MNKSEAAAAVQAAARVDLRLVYLHVYDFVVTDSSAVADFLQAQPDRTANHEVPVRYARELLGVLTTHRLIEETDTPSGESAWQVTNPSLARNDAEQVIDSFLDANIPAPSAPIAKDTITVSTSTVKTAKPVNNPADLPICACGCEAPTSNRKSSYRPGHDARHAGNVARAIAESALVDVDTDTYVADFAPLDALASDKLREKSSAMVDRLLAKKNAKLQKVTAPDATPEPEPVVAVYVDGTITKGRNKAWPARQFNNLVEANTSRNGSGDWIPATTVQAATFAASV